MIAKLPADGNPALGMNFLARILRVAPRTAAKLVDSGQLAGYRIPGSKTRRVLQSEVAEFIRRNGLPAEMLDELSAATMGERGGLMHDRSPMDAEAVG